MPSTLSPTTEMVVKPKANCGYNTDTLKGHRGCDPSGQGRRADHVTQVTATETTAEKQTQAVI